MSCKPRQLNKFVSFLGVSLGGALSFAAICAHRGDETFYSKFLMPFVTKYIDPEIAHEACIYLTKHGLIKCQNSLTQDQASKLETTVFNLKFHNPIGVAAGFDKNSEAVFGLSHYGLGFAEVGTVTPKPQPGNTKKRIFRVPQDKALINRCGFNNKGLEHSVNNLSRKQNFHPLLVGLNLGKNKDSSDAISDYLIGLEKSVQIDSIDYLVINISSPNTIGLRSLQDKENLKSLLSSILEKMHDLSIKKPLLVKIAPDLNDSQLKDIADVIMQQKHEDYKVSGVILTNTTISRPEDYTDQTYEEAGGMSGGPLCNLSTQRITRFYQLTRGQVPIIGVGGVSSGRDAYDKIKAGASLIQLYTGLTYEGPPIINKIKRELVQLMDQDQIQNVADAVGLNHKK